MISVFDDEINLKFLIGHCKIFIIRYEDCPLSFKKNIESKVKELFFKIKSSAFKINWLVNRLFISSLKVVRKYP